MQRNHHGKLPLLCTCSLMNSLHLFPLLPMASLKSSHLVPISPLRPMWQAATRAHQYLVSKHNSTALPHIWQDHVNGGASEMRAVLSHSSWLRQEQSSREPLPVLQQSDSRAARLKQPGSPSCCRKEGWPGASPRLRRLLRTRSALLLGSAPVSSGLFVTNLNAQLTWRQQV